jgi:hypothetical protein
MDVVPPEVGKETIQPSPKVIADIEFTRRAINVLRDVGLGFDVSVRDLQGIYSPNPSPLGTVLLGSSRQIAC